MADQGSYLDDNGSSSEEFSDEGPHGTATVSQTTDSEHLKTDLILRVHAANLPRYGIRKILPDTFVEVTAIHAPEIGSGPVSSSTTSAAALKRRHCGRTEM